MTSRNPIGSGAEKLYEEDDRLRESPAFSLMKLLGLKVAEWAGKFIDKHTGWIARYIPEPREGQGYQREPVPAMVRNALPAGVYNPPMASGGTIPIAEVYAAHGMSIPGYRRRYLKTG